MLTLFSQNNARATGAAMALALCALVATPEDAMADAYIGAGVGQAGIEFEDATVPGFSFSEDDMGWKAFVGYEFGLPLVSLGVEAGYVDFGNPSGDVLASIVEVDADGFSAFGTLGFDLGPLGVFAKYGVISWDSSFTVDGFDAGSDDGSDPAYGVGARFGIGPIGVRAEYEVFDIEDTDDISMVSLGVVWSFD